MQRIKRQEFWKWAFSDFMSNALRGVLAEYIVAKALGGDHEPRSQWDAYDLKTPDGLTTIEVKSSAYLQSWDQEQDSLLRFDIARKQVWDEEKGKRSGKAVRYADIYVFCVFSATDKASADPLDLKQWFFLACRSAFLNNNFKEQKSIGLSPLEQHGLKHLAFEDLAEEIAHLAQPPEKGVRSNKSR